MTIINEFNKELKTLFPNSNLSVLKINELKLDICGDLDAVDFYEFLCKEKWIVKNLEKYLPVKDWKCFRLHPQYAHVRNVLRIASTDTGVEKYAPCFDIREFAIEQFIIAFNAGINPSLNSLFTAGIYLFISSLIRRYQYIQVEKYQASSSISENTTDSLDKPKYTCIITGEPDGAGLDYITDHPWEGNLEETIQFNTIEELFSHDVEGLFYQLFDNESGRRLGYGMIDPDYPATDIQDFEKESEPQGHLVIISGFSRAGKNAIADGLKELSDNYIYSISATTRQPRADERNEVDYHFITPECFENIKESGDFLETAEYCGNSYGTLALPVTKALKEGRDMVLILETEGAMKVKDLYPTALTFFRSCTCCRSEIQDERDRDFGR